MPASKPDFDYVIVGGGFYGCCLALFLRSVADRILVVEAADSLMSRASSVNQARIHTGFHYPRSVVTAVKSMVLHKKFIEDFPQAVNDEFKMLYAVSRRRSKITARRFYRMYREMGAPIELASERNSSLFDTDMVDGVFECYEAAFDHTVLENLLLDRMVSSGISLMLSTELTSFDEGSSGVVAKLNNGMEIKTKRAFNITYSRINSILKASNLSIAGLKHELAEIALVSPPAQFEGLGVTVMDGPFFSCMPYPSQKLHSLTHVRYTPHKSWIDDNSVDHHSELTRAQNPQSCALQMIRDAQRYIPCLGSVKYEKSLYEIKSVLLQNERDDGRPILFHQEPQNSRVISILGGKIDNIYDLFEVLKQSKVEFTKANDNYLMGISP